MIPTKYCHTIPRMPYFGAPYLRRFALIEQRYETISSPPSKPSRPESRVRRSVDPSYGDTAVNTGYYTFAYLKDGEMKNFPARYSFTYVRNGDRWLIVDHHSSAVPSPPK
jgi:Domain of unknown function (DUF4440)